MIVEANADHRNGDACEMLVWCIIKISMVLMMLLLFSQGAAAEMGGEAQGVGFQRFPQAFMQGLVVAYEKPDQAAAESASRLLMVLEREAGVSLDARLASWDEALAGKDAAILVADGCEAAMALGAPLPLTESSVYDTDGRLVLRLADDDSYAALEAYQMRGRNVLLLVHHGAEGAQLCERLVSWLDTQPLGWSALRGDVLLQGPTLPPLDLRVRGGTLRVRPTEAALSHWLTHFRRWVTVGLLFALLAFAAWSYPRVVRRGPAAREI